LKNVSIVREEVSHIDEIFANAPGLFFSMGFSPSSRGRLTDHDLARFPGETLRDRIGRAVCHARCLPRKEFYEAWETARRVRRLFRGGRIVDLGAGHGLLAQLMLILDDTSPRAVAVDTVLPPSAGTLHHALVHDWPRLDGRIAFVASPLESVEIRRSDLVVSIHACGRLTDLILQRAMAVRARVAVLPCCHDAATCDAGGLAGWMTDALAIDAVRARRLASEGYRIWTQMIPAAITPKNRLLIAAPDDVTGRL
jgi:methyltransferase family protein